MIISTKKWNGKHTQCSECSGYFSLQYEDSNDKPLCSKCALRLIGLEDDLKRCPFCGGEAKIDTGYHTVFCVWCTSCLVRTNYEDSIEKVIAVWQRRLEGIY